jgi:hypothetical protein
VIIMHHGRVLADAPPGALAPRLRRTSHVDVEAAAPSDRIMAMLRDVPGVRDVVPLAGDGRCRCEVEPEREARAAIAAKLAAAGIALYGLVPVEPTLEEAFLALTTENAP